jgi:hypothetical protein
MGCHQSRDNADYVPAKPHLSPSNSTGGDTTLMDQNTAPDAAAIAARQRLQKREGSLSKDEVRKKELLGRIDAVYSQRNESRPLGLGAKSADELQAFYSELKAGR